MNEEYYVAITLDKNENLNTKYINIELRFAIPESSDICSMKMAKTNVEVLSQNKKKFY